MTGYPHHVTNRRNERQPLFVDDADYQAFLLRLEQGKERCAVSLYGVCLMPNHVHLLIQPNRDGALSSYFQWVLGRYARDFRSATGTRGHGHVFQGRFWSDLIEREDSFYRVLRYIEANPRRAGLVGRAEEWRWSSLVLRNLPGKLLDPLPVVLPRGWLTLVNQPQTYEELETVRLPRPRGRPVLAQSADAAGAGAK